MSFYWREVGMTYLQYANITARALRSVLKDEFKVQALKREEQYLKMAKWTAGKQGENKLLIPEIEK
ncbi:hypothetical protein SmJEL517_g04703 [Synchytrium microbalum]|uniref:ATP synthase subunit epsilon, mitochondrial n=1 Tax=Synchytrium microbalum TaxID=1806994 RepID=A0A507BXH2_9FUNG|nr:uncharacterized protein SmJEL517_g04703 [Synchytrium microbalum]TPX32132.1 hypothetical protein SmJEL517_g04703 [Synchytrium microbalum]